ncbi:MAG: hypothetical protein GY754_46275, partial [bacterium]|nr:hypothetical protein [bacterium]
MSKHVKKLFTLAAIALLIFISSCQYQEQSNTGSITSELMEQAEVVGGDMIFVNEEAGSKGTMRRTTKTWTMGHIMFTFDPSVGPINMATIRSAMAKWSAEGRINFMEVPCNP